MLSSSSAKPAAEVRRLDWATFRARMLAAVGKVLDAEGKPPPPGAVEELISLVGLPGLRITEALRSTPCQCIRCQRVYRTELPTPWCVDCRERPLAQSPREPDIDPDA